MTAPVPPDFAETAARLVSRKALTRHYGKGKETIIAWMDAVGLPQQVRKERRPCPDDFAALAPTMTKAEIGRHFKADNVMVNRWLAETRTEAIPADQSDILRRAWQHRRPAYRVTPDVSRHTPALAGREEAAAQHLRRFYPQVCHCNERGGADPKGKFWRCGNAVVDGAELVERAERKGFDPGAWRRVPVKETCDQRFVASKLVKSDAAGA